MRVKFCDLNSNLVAEVKKLGFNAVCSDYFLEVCKTKNPVMMTASNPNFTMGGGLDYAFKKNYPHLVNYKQVRGGGNERVGNIIFAITVDDTLKASKQLVKEALEFAVDNTCEHETLVFTGLGTAIGGLAENDFLEVLREIPTQCITTSK
jgi:hypothetical protein